MEHLRLGNCCGYTRKIFHLEIRIFDINICICFHKNLMKQGCLIGKSQTDGNNFTKKKRHKHMEKKIISENITFLIFSFLNNAFTDSPFDLKTSPLIIWGCHKNQEVFFHFSYIFLLHWNFDNWLRD